MWRKIFMLLATNGGHVTWAPHVYVSRETGGGGIDMGIRNSSRYCTPGDADASAIRLNASGPSGDAASAPWHVKKHSLRAERNTGCR